MYNGTPFPDLSTPFSDLSRELRVLVSVVRASERGLFSGTDVASEVVWMAVHEQVKTLMPTLYLGSKATDARPFALLDPMWRAISDSTLSKTPALTANNFFVHRFLRREHRHPPRRGSDPQVVGVARAECVPVAFVPDGIESYSDCYVCY